MEAIIGLVTTGVTKLIELVPLWQKSGAEEREKILARARELVSGLDALFASADANDDAATAAARKAIEDASK